MARPAISYVYITPVYCTCCISHKSLTYLLKKVWYPHSIVCYLYSVLTWRVYNTSLSWRPRSLVSCYHVLVIFSIGVKVLAVYIISQSAGIRYKHCSVDYRFYSIRYISRYFSLNVFLSGRPYSISVLLTSN